jgi:L-lysine exporter family protein LysE/ArgO
MNPEKHSWRLASGSPSVTRVISDSVSGLATGMSLIVAIGAQNAFVLRQGVRRAHVGAVVTVCTLSDYVLMAAGIAGLGTVIKYAPWALVTVRYLGAAFLTWYGLSSAWRARHPEALKAGPNGTGPGSASGSGSGSASASASGSGSGSGSASGSRAGVIGRTLALTWLNPHVYLDTVLLMGSIANTHGHSGRWWFMAGACVASTIWFAGLGFGARLLAPLLARPRSWQVLDLLIAATMLAIAAGLAFD